MTRRIGYQNSFQNIQITNGHASHSRNQSNWISQLTKDIQSSFFFPYLAVSIALILHKHDFYLSFFLSSLFSSAFVSCFFSLVFWRNSFFFYFLFLYRYFNSLLLLTLSHVRFFLISFSSSAFYFTLSFITKSISAFHS